MRIVFFGASELGWECCRTLFEMEQNVVGIFSIPPEFRISWSAAPVRNVRFRGFEDLAQARGVPLIYITKKMADLEYKRALSELKPDILVVIGWYYILPRSLRGLAPLGAVGIHASLLPKYRGGAPLVWAIIDGEAQTGVSLFYLGDGVDEGDIIGQASFKIGFDETIADVIVKATQASVSLVREYVPRLDAGTAPRLVQDHSAATLVPQRKPEDGLIDWRSKSALQVYNWVRAQTRPYPGAFTFMRTEKVVIWRVSLGINRLEHQVDPGTVVVAQEEFPDAFAVSCADGRMIYVREVGLEDGSLLTGSAYVIARNLVSGTLLANSSGKDP